MTTPSDSWEKRVADLWLKIDAFEPADFVAQIEALAAELPADSAIANFERACAQDSTGHSDLAVPLYEAALAKGLTGLRRRRAVIQRASSIRNLGRAEESLQILTKELAETSDDLDQAVRALMALALMELGREREAVSVSLTALSHYLPRYNRSLARYAKSLLE